MERSLKNIKYIHLFNIAALACLIMMLTLISCSVDKKKKQAEGTETIITGEVDSVNSLAADSDIKRNSDSVVKKNALPLLSEVEFQQKDIPDIIKSKISGKVVASVGFNDLNGKNLIIITESEQNKVSEFSPDKFLYGYQFAGKDELSMIWKIQDFIKDCEFDVTLDYIENSLYVSDLDSNGIGESSFLYKLSCKSDVSPDDLKLIMHEGSKKYAIRGVMDLDVTGYGLEKGVMNIDASFNSAPASFRKYAIERWNKFKLERIGN